MEVRQKERSEVKRKNLIDFLRVIDAFCGGWVCGEVVERFWKVLVPGLEIVLIFLFLMVVYQLSCGCWESGLSEKRRWTI